MVNFQVSKITITIFYSWNHGNKVYIPCSPPAQSWRSVFTSCEIFSLHKSLAVFVFRYWSFFTAILFLTSFWNSLLALLEVRPQPDTTTFSPLLRSPIFSRVGAMSSSVEGHGRQIGLVPGFVSFNREFYLFYYFYKRSRK